MDSIISTFHVDLSLFIAQVVNFLIVFAALYFFALKPLVKTMSERSDKIAKSLKDADEIEGRLKATEKEKEEIIAAAKKQALAILEEAEKQGALKREESVAKAKEEISQVINAEKDKLMVEKGEILKDIKSQVADLVVLTVEKFLAEKVDADKDRKIIDHIISK